jgi:hypothetical protein
MHAFDVYVYSVIAHSFKALIGRARSQQSCIISVSGRASLCVKKCISTGGWIIGALLFCWDVAL